MAHWVNVPAIKPENLSLIPGTHMAEREKQLPQAVLWPPRLLGHSHFNSENIKLIFFIIIFRLFLLRSFDIVHSELNKS